MTDLFHTPIPAGHADTPRRDAGVAAAPDGFRVAVAAPDMTPDVAARVEAHCRDVWPRDWDDQPEHVKRYWRATYRIVFEGLDEAERMRP